MGEIFPELGGVVEAEEVGVGLLLLLEDSLILLLLCVGLKEEGVCVRRYHEGGAP